MNGSRVAASGTKNGESCSKKTRRRALERRGVRGGSNLRWCGCQQARDLFQNVVGARMRREVKLKLNSIACSKKDFHGGRRSWSAVSVL